MSNLIGYDTVRFVSEYSLGSYEKLVYKRKVSEPHGEYICYKYKGEDVFETFNKVTLNASIGKILFNESGHLVDCSQTQKFLDLVSEDLGLDFGMAKVTRLDFAQDILTNRKAELYYPLLGLLPKAKKKTKGSLYYKLPGEELNFYDKHEHLKDTKQKVPNHLKGHNVLRYEMRIKPNPTKTLKNNDLIIGNTLTKQDFFEFVKSRHLERFQSIQKLYPVEMNIENVRTPNDFKELLSACKIQEIGLESCLLLFAKPPYKETSAQRQARHRLIQWVRKKANDKDIQKPSELIDELIGKIGNSL